MDFYVSKIIVRDEAMECRPLGLTSNVYASRRSDCPVSTLHSNLNVDIADVVAFRVDFDSLPRTWVSHLHASMLDRCQICSYNIGEG
jgi:hypothetical protein